MLALTLDLAVKFLPEVIFRKMTSASLDCFLHRVVVVSDAALFQPTTCPVCASAVPALTQIPKSKTNEEAITGLLQLAHDCSAAYGQAAEKGSDAEFKQAMQKFAGQADSHIKQWRGRSSFSCSQTEALYSCGQAL